MSLNNTLEISDETHSNNLIKVRRSSVGDEAQILADIYDDDVNIVTWHRTLSTWISEAAKQLLIAKPDFQTSMTVSPNKASACLREALGSDDYQPLAENAAELVDMFCCLFDLAKAGLRLTALNKAMCPKFHVDRVPCRLITTYQGVATEWLPHNIVDRSKLGLGSNGLPDHESGLYQSQDQIQRLAAGSVALLKGENWIDNENAGLVHRSPAVATGNYRLLFTLDFAS